MVLDFTGAFKVVARLPAGPMTLNGYFDHYMGDTTISEVGDGGYKIAVNPTFMDRTTVFKLGEPFQEVLEGGHVYTTVVTTDNEHVLVQSTKEAGSNNEFSIVRNYHGKPLSMYAHKDQVEILLFEGTNLLPWTFVLVSR